MKKEKTGGQKLMEWKILSEFIRFRFPLKEGEQIDLRSLAIENNFIKYDPEANLKKAYVEFEGVKFNFHCSGTGFCFGSPDAPRKLKIISDFFDKCVAKKVVLIESK